MPIYGYDHDEPPNPTAFRVTNPDGRPPDLPIMQITDTTGEIFYLPGNDEEEALASFGDGCEIRHGHWTPNN